MNQAKTRQALSGNFSTASPGMRAVYSEKITPGLCLSEVVRPDGYRLTFRVKLTPERKKA